MGIKISELEILKSRKINEIKQILKNEDYSVYIIKVKYKSKSQKAFYFRTIDGKEFIAFKNYILYKKTDDIILKIKMDKEIKETVKKFKNKEIDDILIIQSCNDYHQNKTVIHYENYGYRYTEIMDNLIDPDIDKILAHAIFF